MSTNPDRHYPGKELEVMAHAVNYHRWIVAELAPYLGRSLVEVGAGIGDLTRLLLEAPVEKIHAFEPSTELFAQLDARLGNESRVTLVNDFLTGLALDGQADSVAYVNVLEHIEDDRGELRTAASLLRPGGHLLIFVPALSWLFSEADRAVGHFRRYHLKPLVEMVEQSGFSIVKARYFDLLGVLPWYLNFVLMKNSFGTRSVTLYDRLAVPPMRQFEKWVRPPVGKNILLAARKN